MPDIVELLQRLDRVGFVTRWAAGNCPGACSDLHVACETMVAYSRRAVQTTSNQNGISRLAIRAAPKQLSAMCNREVACAGDSRGDHHKRNRIRQPQ